MIRMRALDRREEDALRLIGDNTTRDIRCGFCGQGSAEPDYQIDGDVVQRLLVRDLIRIERCDVVYSDLHAWITPTGIMLLGLVALARDAA
jgi:hypothetical protein